LATPEADYYRLRTEWLRFKSHLFDSLTELPTLPATIEEVRRIVESRGAAEVLYLDLGRSGRHETKLGWAAYDQAIRDFAGLLISLRATGEIGHHDLICLHTVRSDRFLIFRGAGPDEAARSNPKGPEPSEVLLAVLRSRLAGAPPASALRSIRLGAGHAWVREDPMVRAERGIQQAVADAMLGSLEAREGAEVARRDELAQMITHGGVRTVFHPIVRLRDGFVVGHEALTRPLSSRAFESVEDLFAFAESTDLIIDFERLCRSTAIQSARNLPPGGLLFLNASAQAVEDPEWATGGVDKLLHASGLRPEDVVVEITERVAIVYHDAFRLALRTFKDRGFRVAVDDMGAGYSSLQALASVEPDFLKLDVSLNRDIDRSGIKRSLLESLRMLADKIRAQVIAEGVEREGERATLLALGIELGQGFHFHREESA